MTLYSIQSNCQIYCCTQTDSMILWIVILSHTNQYTIYDFDFDFCQTQFKPTHVSLKSNSVYKIFSLNYFIFIFSYSFPMLPCEASKLGKEI